MKKIKLYGIIQKAEKQKDGTLIVKGIASTEAVDGDGEKVKATAMKAAIPDYMKFGAVREMHQPIAAGVAIRCEVNKKGQTAIEAKIVDPITIKKIEEGVLQGFSIGGKVTGRDKLDKSIITGIRLSEISVVDRPCNPEAKIDIFKAEKEDKEAEKEEKEEKTEDKDEKSSESDEKDEKEDDSDDSDDEKDKKDDDSDDSDSESDSDDEKSDDSDEDEDSDSDSDSDSDDEDDEDEDSDSEKLAKLSKAHGNALSKILKLESDLKKVSAQLAHLKKSPAPAKGILRAVPKGQDVIDPESETDIQKQAEIFSTMQPMDQAQTLVKLIHGGK